jgi:carboxyl-terminal processing protease
MNGRRRKFFITIMVTLAFLGTYLLGFGTAASISGGWLGQQITSIRFGGSQQNSVDFSLYWDVWNRVHRDYVGTVDDQALFYSSVKGMVNGLGDPYTVFMDPTEAKRFDEDVTGEFSGIGIEIGIKDEVLTVIAPLDDTPAQKAGLKSGDIIAKIDGKDSSGMTINDAVSKIRGTKDTTVKLTILPKGVSEFKDLEIKRDTITIKSVKYEVKNGNIGYVRITQFSQDTPNAVKSALNDLKSKNITGIILDLRSNPGGYLDGAQQIASQFISSGVVVSEQEKSGQKRDLYTTSDPIIPNLPMAVLVDGGSASASEIVAGAIQDRARAKLIGEKTFGKGSVQNVENLPGGAMLKVTIAKWLTPSGRQINGEGIKPDIEIKMTASEIVAGKDTQLDKAIEIVSVK